MKILIAGAAGRVAQTCTKIPAAPKPLAHAACHRASRCAIPPDGTSMWIFIHNPLGKSR